MYSVDVLLSPPCLKSDVERFVYLETLQDHHICMDGSFMLRGVCHSVDMPTWKEVLVGVVKTWKEVLVGVVKTSFKCDKHMTTPWWILSPCPPNSRLAC